MRRGEESARRRESKINPSIATRLAQRWRGARRRVRCEVQDRSRSAPRVSSRRWIATLSSRRTAGSDRSRCRRDAARPIRCGSCQTKRTKPRGRMEPRRRNSKAPFRATRAAACAQTVRLNRARRWSCLGCGVSFSAPPLVDPHGAFVILRGNGEQRRAEKVEEEPNYDQPDRKLKERNQPRQRHAPRWRNRRDLFQTRRADDAIVVLGNALTTIELPALRTACDGFAQRMMKAALMNERSHFKSQARVVRARFESLPAPAVKPIQPRVARCQCHLGLR